MHVRRTSIQMQAIAELEATTYLKICCIQIYLYLHLHTHNTFLWKWLVLTPTASSAGRSSVDRSRATALVQESRFNLTCDYAEDSLQTTLGPVLRYL